MFSIAVQCIIKANYCIVLMPPLKRWHKKFKITGTDLNSLMNLSHHFGSFPKYLLLKGIKRLVNGSVKEPELLKGIKKVIKFF